MRVAYRQPCRFFAPRHSEHLPDSSSSAGHEVSSRLVGRDILRAPRGAPGRPFGAVERAVLKLPLPENQVPAAQRALDHLAQGAEGFTLAVVLLRNEVGTCKKKVVRGSCMCCVFLTRWRRVACLSRIRENTIAFAYRGTGG